MVAPKRGQKLSWEVRTEGGGKPVGETRVRRSYVLGKKEPLVTSPCEGVNTMLDLADYAATKHGDRPFLGTRPVIKVHPAEEGALELYELGPYSWLSFIEVRQLMLQAGAGLRQLGLGRSASTTAVADAPFITLYAESSVNWRLVSMGAASISSPFATAFSTLDADGLKHTINLPGSVAVFTQADLIPKLAIVLRDTPTVNSVIYDGQADNRALQAIRDLGIRPVTVDELLRLGRAYPAPPTPPTANDLYAVQFTSGTSGLPKGVEVTHRMMLSAVAAIDRLLDDYYVDAYEQSHCAFLPLAHAIESCNSANLWFQGVRSGFGKARTLMATGVKNCEGDLAELKPTTIGAVPLVWETIRKAVELQLSQASPVTRGLFSLSYWAKENGIPLLAQAGDAVVLSKVRAFTGGQLNACLSGGAALSASTNAWFKSTGIADIMNGWGLTETIGMGALTHPSTWSAKGDGACLMACVEVKLADRPESGYRSTDALPSGEILIRGPAVFQRYYKNPEATAEALDEEGFFKTGDIGRFTAAGALEIVDRLKNLVKLPNGEYIALEKLESVLKASPLVANIVLVVPVGADSVSAVAVPHAANLFKLLQTRGLLPATASATDPTSVAAVVADPKVRRAYLGEVNAFGKAAGLSRRELLGAVVVVADVWDPDSGLVTATLKPKRKAIESRYAAELEAANAPRARL